MIILEKPKVLPWRFLDFTHANGNNPIEDWYNSLGDYGQQIFNSLLKNNSKIDIPIKWTGLKFLKGDMSGIWELRFTCDRVEQRLLGMFDGAKRAVFLMGCYHKGGNYTPPDALQTTLKRRASWEKGDCIKSNERQITTD